MYYDLTKEEYKKYERNFKKTYVGKTWFAKWNISCILFVVACFGVYFEVLTDFIDNVTFKIDAIDIICFICILLFGILTIFYQFEYRSELKSYINFKNKK